MYYNTDSRILHFGIKPLNMLSFSNPATDRFFPINKIIIMNKTVMGLFLLIFCCEFLLTFLLFGHLCRST